MNKTHRLGYAKYVGPGIGPGSLPSRVATLSARPGAATGGRLRRAREAGWLLVRADRTGDLSPSWLRSIGPRRLIYALRTRRAGGDADPSDPLRPARLREAAREYDLVELEAPHDLVPEVLASVPPDRRIVSWRGPAEGTPALTSRLQWLSGVEAAAYQLIVDSRCVEDGLAPLEVLHAAGRRDVVAFADGEAGVWSRALSAMLGAPLVFGALDDEPGSVEPTVARLVEDFGLPDPGPVRMLFGVVGNPVAHSLSPRLHNASYRAMGIPALFLPFRVDSFEPFWRELVASDALDRLGFPLRGLTVSSPNKEASVAAASAVSPASRRAGSANLLHRRHGHWVADTTDPAGVLETLSRRGIAVAGRRAAVVGCGGSGRAIASALSRAGATVVLSNRGRPRGERASRRLGLPLVELSAFSAADYDLIVNATSVGRDGEGPPFACDRLAPGAVVVDLVYAPTSTPLAAAVVARGARLVEGHEVLLVQASRQFAKMTGKVMPVDLVAGLAGLPSAAPVPPGRATPRLPVPAGEPIPTVIRPMTFK